MDNRNKRGGRIVKHQKTRVIQTDKNYSGERSPYWDYAHEHSENSPGVHASDHQEFLEPVQANPDSLPESASIFPQESGLSVGDISKQLSGQQRKVFELYVQEGKSEKEIAVLLGISYNTVRTYLARVRERFKFYV